ncbi:MAG: PEPxxWA-CTERM sorting domain-containing protein, partial [Sphingomicrobium sp.]
IQLAGDGDISIFYLLSGLADLPANYVLAGCTPFSQKYNQNNNYILTGGTFNAIKIVTTSHLFEVKQNSINLAAAFVPEPGTWGLMLLGFGGIGLALRRRRRTATLMQLA